MALAWVASLVPTYGYTKPVCHPNPGPCEGPYINIATFTVLFHVVEFLAYHLLWKHKSFTLNKDALARGLSLDAYRWSLARVTPGVIVWSTLPIYSIYAGLSLAAMTDEPLILVPDHEAGNEGICLYSRVTCRNGCVFSAYIFYQFGKLLRGHDKGVGAWVHHIVYSVTTFTCPAYLIGPEIVLLAVGMEASTPFLLALEKSRDIEFDQGLSFLLLILFASTFVVARIGIFGFELVRVFGAADMAWLSGGEDDATMTASRQLVYAATVAALTAGWSLSVFWTFFVIAKVRRAVARGGVAALKAYLGMGGNGACNRGGGKDE